MGRPTGGLLCGPMGGLLGGPVGRLVGGPESLRAGSKIKPAARLSPSKNKLGLGLGRALAHRDRPGLKRVSGPDLFGDP